MTSKRNETWDTAWMGASTALVFSLGHVRGTFNLLQAFGEENRKRGTVLFALVIAPYTEFIVVHSQFCNSPDPC